MNTALSPQPSAPPSVNGHAGLANGPYHDSNGDSAGSTSFDTQPMNGYSQQNPFQAHNDEIIRHLYHSGFQSGNYADTFLHVGGHVYRLHAIILSRSPYLAHLMSTSPQTTPHAIYVNLEHEPEVTQEGFAIALGYLYSSVSLDLIRPENARGVLAAGCLLGGMDDLCSYAYEVCRQSITVDTINDWVSFVDTMPSPSVSGVSTPVDIPPPASIFGLYAQRLREDVFNFLVVTLPNTLGISATSSPTQADQSKTGRDTLLHIFSRVPFDLFKAAVEAPQFQIGSDQARFKFAKEAIDLRKRGVARGSGAEETVVLAFGASPAGGSTVHVTRKMRKRPLWKVNSPS
ncbi:hypothetical protein GLOTRDRAFT_57377 [Gloeophyllum trabeum ATCC 11539]|uniref:BTB domain-containing protein n=1 Tax=Gloeophyllum trabeum (strain ATCC 11539 / FP-39264 / Madison 617) TaxID=670483 RepID=S7RUK6_GLOTA|nr:uncharacterized protein GLOTRDRAFT_57377 [Gloeophyllum trabeum ATCC 11539]EPQ58415.1 hypothetical protein GLOTRDRAFT_57377 [Gloeophyllum trabeum ATCC 11539]